MKINNSRIDFYNPSRIPAQEIKYWAVYNDGKYFGVYTLDSLVTYVDYFCIDKRYVLKAYARKSQNVRGKVGHYKVTYYGVNNTEVTYIKNRAYAIRRAKALACYGHRVDCIDDRTGEVLFYQESKYERNNARHT